MFIPPITRFASALAIMSIVVTGCVHSAEPLHSGPKDLYIGMAMIGRDLKNPGDDIGPAEEVQNLIEEDFPFVTISGLSGYDWKECQPNDPGDGPNVYDWSKGDKLNDGSIIPGKSRTSGFSVHGSCPEWLEFDSPRYWQKFEEFVEAMVVHMNERYGEVDFIFENEPNSTRKPAHFEGNWADWYMHCLKHFYPAVHRANAKTGKDNNVIAANLAGRSAGGIDELYRKGFKDYSDVIGDHPYPYDIRDGVAVWDLAEIHAVQVKYGDGDKKIYISEGWGSGRSAGFERSDPAIPMPAEEVENMWLAMVKGWDNLMTPRQNWDPSYLYGVKFFCGNDNWGASGWRKRAEVSFDGNKNVNGFRVDGYWMTPDIAPQFWNGGMMDWYGNSKDCLIHVFPGDGLVFMNPGFELASSPPKSHVPMFWTPIEDPPLEFAYGRHTTVLRNGSRSLMLNRPDGRPTGVYQMSVKRSAKLGVEYRASVWCKTEDLKDVVGRFYMRFCDIEGSRKSEQFLAEPLKGDADWTRMSVKAKAPDFTSRIEVGCLVEGLGVAYFDDVTICAVGQKETGTIKGYTLDENHVVVPNSIVRTTSGGYQAVSDSKGRYEIEDVALGTYDLVCRKSGYVPFKVTNQTVAPEKVTYASFCMRKPKPGLTITSLSSDKPSVSVEKGIVNVAVGLTTSTPYSLRISEVGIFIEQNGKDATSKFVVVPSSLNPLAIGGQGEEKFKFMIKPLPESAGQAYTINAYAFGQEERPNLLRNGSFHSENPFEYWNINPGPEDRDWALDTTEYYSPPNSLRCYVDGKGDREFYWAGNHSLEGKDSVPAKPATKYMIGAYHKDKTKGRIDINLYIGEYYHDGERRYDNGRRFSAVPKRDVWTNDYFIYETGNPEVTKGLYSTNRLGVAVGAWVREKGDNVQSTYWWDDIYVREVGDWLADDRADKGVKLNVTK